MNLHNVSTEELQKELAKRQSLEQVKASITPVAFDQERFDIFSKKVQGVVQDIMVGQDKDSEHWIFEETLMFIYGGDIFTKLNQFYR